jgi:acyl carrier protein phosphodiesterase
MNFLAHVYLSGKNVSLAIGNLIADRVKGNTLDEFPPMIQKGILLHRKIDHFTDHHENFKACVQLLFPVYRHYSRVIVDMYFDHFLAVHWEKYHPETLNAFSAEFYTHLKAHSKSLPDAIQKFTEALIRYNWFETYATPSGLELILTQMEKRTQFPSKLGSSIKELNENYTYFQSHFTHFMKAVIPYVNNEIKTL